MESCLEMEVKHLVCGPQSTASRTFPACHSFEDALRIPPQASAWSIDVEISSREHGREGYEKPPPLTSQGAHHNLSLMLPISRADLKKMLLPHMLMMPRMNEIQHQILAFLEAFMAPSKSPRESRVSTWVA